MKPIWCPNSRLTCEFIILKLDAGMHPAKEGFSALPFFDEFDLSTVDILLISQYVQPKLAIVYYLRLFTSFGDLR